jgi:hypothetical protein
MRTRETQTAVRLNCMPLAGSVEDKRSLAIQTVVDLFEQAARGDYPGWALSEAMATIHRNSRVRLGGPISKSDCDRLLAQIVRVQLIAPLHLASEAGSQFEIGMKAVAFQVMFWAETFERTASRPTHFVTDTYDHARIVRNIMYNVSLLEMIEDRALAREGVSFEYLTNSRC